MANTINERLEQLREVMRRERLAAFIFPSTDPHQSEYVADHWKSRQWISGFDGSAGTAVVTLHSAALWTDSRYFLAAEEQLRGTGYQLMKLKMEGTPTIAQWIGDEIRNDDSTEVGIDGMVSSVNQVRQLIADLRQQGGITLRTNLDALQHIWTDRPPVPQNPVEIHSLEYAGEPTASKLSRIRQTLHERHADGMLMASLDDIAWTLNLRGGDVHCNPVFVSYLLIASKSATLFVDRQKLTPGVLAYLKQEGIQVDDYANVASGLKSYFEYNILLDPNEVNYALYDVVKNYTHNDTRSHVQIVEEKSPVKAMKAIKNDTEIQGFRRAMLKDGIAMVKFLKWLKPAVEAGGQTEMSLDA
ncbi:MAG: aminopeptidase P family N-terminal domain-containing protein, partial [Prevotella sp.]|nr:aminopeptidase P family N-terminal domain-containing protein [Prevotella sp.]